MKKATIFILSFFVCLSFFAQDPEKQYFENHPELGGDVVIKSASFKSEKDEVYKTFEVESLGEGSYYVDAWIMAPVINDGYPEYKVAVNGILTEFTFKPQTDGWHSLALTNAKKSVVAVNLRKGMNTISIIGKKPQVPSVEFIKMSSSLARAGIPDTNYKMFVEKIKSNALNSLVNSDQKQIGSNRGTAGQIYDYYLDLPHNFTQWWTYDFSSGENVSISAGSSSFPCGIELFHISNPESYSWSAGSTTGTSNLNVTIPAGGDGCYVLLIRALNPGNIGETTMTRCSGVGDYYYCSTNNMCIVTYSPQIAVTPGYSTPANFFTCKLRGKGYPWLFLGDESGRIKAYSYYGDITSDGYLWGMKNPRITTSLPDIAYGMVFRKYVYTSDNDTCDLYMGLAPANNSLFWSKYQTWFPKLAADNSFISGHATGNYICYDWSLGETSWVHISSPDTAQWSKFYDSYGYTRDGANADNAAIALWTRPDINIDFNTGNVYNYLITHASVRKNTVNPVPHGFEWESKIFGDQRIMHTRDALAGNEYGSITCYYRPKNGIVNFSPPAPSANRESSFSTSDLNQAAALRSQIPVTILSGFEEKYQAWEKTWDRPELVFQSNPYLHARSTEYENLLEYSKKYGKAVWTLLIDKVAQGDIFVLNLLKDLTYGGKWSFYDDNTQIPEKGQHWPSTHTVLVDYCKKLLAKEEVNMLKSIQDISSVETEPFVLDVSANNSQGVLLKMYSEKDEKAVVSIYSISGHQEYKSNHHFQKGNQKVAIRNSKLKKGIYVVNVTVDSKSTSQTISI